VIVSRVIFSKFQLMTVHFQKVKKKVGTLQICTKLSRVVDSPPLSIQIVGLCGRLTVCGFA